MATSERHKTIIAGLALSEGSAAQPARTKGHSHDSMSSVSEVDARSSTTSRRLQRSVLVYSMRAGKHDGPAALGIHTN